MKNLLKTTLIALILFTVFSAQLKALDLAKNFAKKKSNVNGTVFQAGKTAMLLPRTALKLHFKQHLLKTV